MRSAFLGLSAMVLGASASELVVNVGLQTGSFLFGKDISMLNAHDYRPNEFVTSDVRHSTCPKPQTQDPRYTHGPSSLTPHAFGARSLCTRGSPPGMVSTTRAWTASRAMMTTLWPRRWPRAGPRTMLRTLRHPPPPSK